MLIVKSPVIFYGETVPKIYTCDGSNISPPISWSKYPPETQSFVLIMDDPDAPIGVFTHWVIYDIPANINELPENFPNIPEMDSMKQGINDFGNIGYDGPCPPLGKPHRYFFRIFALEVPSLQLPPGSSRQEVELIMTGKVVDEGYLMGLYSR